MNIEEIARIAELMAEHDLSEFLIEAEDMKLCIKRGRDGVAGMPHAVAPTVFSAPAPAPAAAPAPAEEPLGKGKGRKPGCASIDSPIVGTFYTAPAPDAPPYVKVGDEVSEETVVCIVEAMKVMNEIKAERRGVIERILVDNATPVEFGQPLFELRPL